MWPKLFLLGIWPADCIEVQDCCCCCWRRQGLSWFQWVHGPSWSCQIIHQMGSSAKRSCVFWNPNPERVQGFTILTILCVQFGVFPICWLVLITIATWRSNAVSLHFERGEEILTPHGELSSPTPNWLSKSANWSLLAYSHCSTLFTLPPNLIDWWADV